MNGLRFVKRHRFATSIFALVLLVLTQQAAVLHQLGHLRSTDGQSTERHDRQLAGKLCADCVAFAQVLSASPNALTTVAMVRHSLPVQPGPTTLTCDPALPRARARDPPLAC